MQREGIQPFIPLQSAEDNTVHAAPSKQQSNSNESAHHEAKISSLNAQVEQLKADKQALLARLTSAEPEEEEKEEEEEGGDKLAKLDTEVAQLKTDRQLLISRVSASEQMLAEARRAVDQKEGHLQGLQVGAVTHPSLALLQADVWSSSHTTRKMNAANTAVLPTDRVSCLLHLSVQFGKPRACRQQLSYMNRRATCRNCWKKKSGQGAGFSSSCVSTKRAHQ